MAERFAWQMDHTGITGIGTDESGTVRVTVDDAGQVQRVDISSGWWRGVGPDRLSAAILNAAQQAVTNRALAWSDRVSRRADGEPQSADSRDPMERRRSEWGSGGLRPVEASAEEKRVEDLLRVFDVCKAAMAEVDDYRRQVEAQVRQQVLGRGRNDRVTVAMTGGQITEIDIDRRWLREQPSGQAIGDEVYVACQDAYQRAAGDKTVSRAGLPALAELRELTADPAALLRRLGLTR